MRDAWEEEDRAFEQDKQRNMMQFLLTYKPEDAVAILQGKEPVSAPPSDEGPMDERAFLMQDRYFHMAPPHLRRGGR